MKWLEMSYSIEPSERHYIDECDEFYFEDGICSYGLLENLTYSCCLGVEQVMEMIWSE